MSRITVLETTREAHYRQYFEKILSELTLHGNAVSLEQYVEHLKVLRTS